MSEKLSEVKFMNAIAEASFLVRRVAEPSPSGDTVKQAISRACRRLGSWSWNRVKDVWYADPRITVSADELAQLRRAVRAQQQEADRADLTPIKHRLARIETAIRISDEAFHRESLDAIGEQLDLFGRMGRAMDEGEKP